MNISELHVMESAAGFYLGRTYFDEECSANLPYSRQSGYFRDEATAKRALETYPEERRDCLDNQLLYLKEDLLGDPRMPLKD